MPPKASPSFLAPLLALTVLAAMPAASAWSWSQDEANLAHRIERGPLANDTYVLVGVDTGQPPGPVLRVRHCWQASGDARLQEGSPGCWREEDGEDAFPGQQGAKVVLAAVIFGKHQCFAEVDGTEVNHPCCSREESYLPSCAAPQRRVLP